MSHLFDKLYNTYSKVQDALTFNAATLSGAIDIIVVQHDDGLLTSTPFHVRFGKLQLLKSREKLVTIAVNGHECDFRMKLGHAGEAFFVFDADKQQPATEEELSSPITSPILAPAAVMTTLGTITAINPIVDSGDKRHSDGTIGTPSTRSRQEESKVPDLDLSRNTLSPPPRRAPGRLSTPPARTTVPLDSTSETSSHHVRYSSSPPASIAPRRLLDDSEENLELNSELERRRRLEVETHNLAEQQLQASEAEAEKGENSSALSRSTPMTPRTLEPTMRLADNDSPRTMPPFPRLCGTLSMDSALLSPHSPLTPTSPTSPPDSDRMMSAPSAADARDHTWQWTWGTLPVHHQRNKPNDTARSEQVIHPASTASPAVTTPHGNSVGPPSPMPSLPTAAFSPSSSSAPAQATDQTTLLSEPTQPSVSTHSHTIDSAPAGWSMRGIFSTVLSKLPYGGGGGSATDSAAVQAVAAAKDPAQIVDECGDNDETERLEEGVAPSAARGTSRSMTRAAATTPTTSTGSTLSPLSLPSDGSINLAEAHLALPWLRNEDADATVAAPSQIKRPQLRPSNVIGSQAFTSPLSAPLPSMPAPTAASAASSPSSSVSSDRAVSFSFSLPSRARASNAGNRSLLQLDAERHPHPVMSLPSIAVELPTVGDDEAGTATTASSLQAPSFTISSPTSALTDPLSTPPAPPTSVDQTTLRLSLCGLHLGSSASLNQQLFDQHGVSFETLSLQPELTFRSDLVILYQSKLYPSRVALPLILSTLAFSRPLAITQAALDRLNTMALPHLPMGDVDVTAASLTDSAVEKAVVNSPESGGRSWRDWFRSKKPPPIDTVSDGSRTVLASTQAAATAQEQQQPEEQKQATMRQSKSMEDLSTLADENHDNADAATSITIHSPNFTSRSAVLPSLDPLAALTAPSSAASSPKAACSPSKPTFIKSLRPTSNMLRSLNLQPGRNLVSFTVSSALQGEQTVKASIFLWRSDVKIVISDVDGTITRSDVLGHVLPLVGRDW